MRTSMLLAICVILLSSGTCKKTTSGNTSLAADSMQISRTGGFAGFSDHYMIAKGQVRKDTSKRDNIKTFGHILPGNKYELVKVLLRSVPDQMMKESGKTYGEMVDDGIEYNVTAYSRNNTYRWTIKHDEPAYVQPFTQKLNEAFSALQ